MYYPEQAGRNENVPLPDPKTYTNEDGETYLYHDSMCQGPYSTTSAARSQLTRETESYWALHRKDYLVYVEVEETTGSWKKVPKKVK